MIEKPVQIKFQNALNPEAKFDFLKSEEIFKKEITDHSPFHLHRVDFYLILLIEKGHGTHTIDFTDYKLKEGTILTIRKDQIHKFYKNDSIQFTLLLFTDEFLVSYLEELEALKSLQLFNEFLGQPKMQLPKAAFKEVCDLLKRLETEYFKVYDDYSLGIIRSELHILLAKLFRIKTDKNPVISARKYLSEFTQFQSLVEEHVVQYKKVKDYAKMLGLSTKTLNTVTKNIVNKTAKEFIDDICIKQIKRLLINTEHSIKEIAYAAGFEETTNLYKYFKRQTKLTPEQFRATF